MVKDIYIILETVFDNIACHDKSSIFCHGAFTDLVTAKIQFRKLLFAEVLDRGCIPADYQDIEGYDLEKCVKIGECRFTDSFYELKLVALDSPMSDKAFLSDDCFDDYKRPIQGVK